jgi:hypothetical protein
MKITEQQLKQIIKEEVKKALNEAPDEPPSGGWYVRARDPKTNPWGAKGNRAWWKIHGPYHDDPPKKVKQSLLALKDFIWNKSERP